MHVFRNSLDNESFPEKIKIAKVTPIFKTGEKDRRKEMQNIYFFKDIEIGMIYP